MDIDIPHVLAELKRIGMTQTEIGREIGVRQSSVSDMANRKSGVTKPSAKVVDGLRELAEKHGLTIAQRSARTARHRLAAKRNP